MKKFLTRALPLCLALLIFVGSLAVPAFAAATDTVTISGTWVFFENTDLSSSFTGSSTAVFPFIIGSYTCNQMTLDPQSSNVCQEVNAMCMSLIREGRWRAPSFSVIGSAEVAPGFYDKLCKVAYYAGPTELVGNSGNGPSIFSVFSGISSWIVGSIGTIMPMFYTEATGLTFIGVLAVAALALGVCFLIFALIRRFMNFG